jgi:hypothetical protein
MNDGGKFNTAGVPDPKELAAFTPKYGVTCVGCDTPHDSGSATGAWNGEFDGQVSVDTANGSASTLDASPIPYATATAVATVTPSPATTVVRKTLTVTQDGMP